MPRLALKFDMVGKHDLSNDEPLVGLGPPLEFIFLRKYYSLVVMILIQVI